MASPFDNLTLQQSSARLTAARAAEWRTATQQNRAAYAGDHWQGGAWWVGPWPYIRPGMTPAEADLALLGQVEIQRGFTPENVLAETVLRHRDAVIGREPTSAYALERPITEAAPTTEEEQSLLDEAGAGLTAWWDGRAMTNAFKLATTDALLAEYVVLRYIVPPDELGDDGRLLRTPSLIAEAMDALYVEVVDAEHAAVLTDPRTKRQIGIYRYKDGEEDRAEVCYIDRDTEETVVRILSAEGVVSETRLQLGGLLIHHEIRLDPFIGEPFRRQQRLLNLSVTMMQRNVVLAGFLERVLINADLPVREVADPDAPNGVRVTPDPIQVGGGTINTFVGVTTVDETGRPTGMATPSYLRFDPVSPDAMLTTRDAAYGAMLRSTRQVHAQIAGDATASAVSRIQARADFLASVRPTKSALDTAGRWVLDTLLALAAALMGQSGLWAGLRGTFEATLDLGPMTPEERAQILSEVDAGLLPREDAIVLLGRVEDGKAALQRIVAERELLTPAALLGDPDDDDEDDDAARGR